MEFTAVSAILRSRNFRLGLAIIWGIQMLILLITTPMYEIDTNSFIRGGFSWDIYHNPFLNIFGAVFSKIWSNLHFLIGLQLLVHAFAASLLISVLFGPKNRWIWAGLAIAALEPVSLYYHLSLISESFYTSFTALSVAFLILWMRKPSTTNSLAFGVAMGLTFWAKLSAMIHTPLFLLILLKRGVSWKTRFISLGLALIPFLFSYYGVQLGQKAINGSGLYTVEGRVRWDFSSSQYRPEEINAPLFKRFVDETILNDTGELEPMRERRREFSYTGYKKCVTFFESQDGNEVAAIDLCDSIFGDVAAQILKKHKWEASKQFIRDNLHDLTHLSYIDYRHTPNMPFHYAESEYQYIDSLMAANYGVNLAERVDRIPSIWRSLSFGNFWMTSMAIIWSLLLLWGAAFWFRKGRPVEIFVMGGLLLIPLLFHTIYISYRPRFWAPYLVLMLLWGLWMVWKQLESRRAGGKS